MNIKLIIIVIIVALVVGIGGWYVYSIMVDQQSGSQTAQSTAIDSTTNISADLNAAPDDAAANTELNNLNQTVQGF